jgi:hypothetical protein
MDGRRANGVCDHVSVGLGTRLEPGTRSVTRSLPRADVPPAGIFIRSARPGMTVRALLAAPQGHLGSPRSGQSEPTAALPDNVEQCFGRPAVLAFSVPHNLERPIRQVEWNLVHNPGLQARRGHGC